MEEIDRSKAIRSMTNNESSHGTVREMLDQRTLEPADKAISLIILTDDAGQRPA